MSTFALVTYKLYPWIVVNPGRTRVSFTLEIAPEVSIFHEGEEEVWGVAGVQRDANES